MWTYQENNGGRSNLRWKDACKRELTEAGSKEDNAKRMEEEANQLHRRPQMTGQAREEDDVSIKSSINLRRNIFIFTLSYGSSDKWTHVGLQRK